MQLQLTNEEKSATLGKDLQKRMSLRTSDRVTGVAIS